jgi:CheY-like chemotaxis protein
VLVCDDEQHMTRLIQIHLERLGHQIVRAHGGREAIECLQENTFDAAIIDLVMPYVDGLDVLKWIRENPATKDMWVAIATANTKELLARKDMPYRPDAFVTKPFDPSSVLPN